ncbi:hypothetical protein ACJMK2_038589 [Sinanodonta woodiana]|uniref:NACHT domain-containing protein n=1 Tax=Sinanodonta woodiana TaxID=1069815 RepID=A0ABD3WAW0_SINWO
MVFDYIIADVDLEKMQHGKKTEKTMCVCPLCEPNYFFCIFIIENNVNFSSTSYEQIFLDRSSSKLRRVYLLRKRGLSKTTLCRKIINDWCNAHEGRAVAQGGSFQDEDVLPMFDIFCINLRKVSFEKKLIEAICALLPVEKVPSKHILGPHLKFNGDKVLFILDGLDEMIVKADFIKNVLSCCFMQLGDRIEIDQSLDLKGFSQRNAQEFTKELFENCYNDGNAIKQFTENIACNKLVPELIHVPLLLHLLVQIWYENKRSLPNKLHELYIVLLNRMADRIMEKNKRDPNHRQMRFTVDDINFPFPSKISQTSLAVNCGEGFLLSLCEVAHHFFLSSEKENSLIFKETNLLNALGERGEEKLEMALDLGILSVTNSMFCPNRETSVSFLHETIQEFFTAFCLIVKPEKFTNFISSMADLNDVQRNENIVVFLVGLMPELGNKVLEKCNELCKDDLEYLWTEEGMDRHKYRELDIINTMYLRCKREVIGEDVLLTVSRLRLGQSDLDLQCWNPAVLQSLDLIGTQMSHVHVNLRGFTGIQYLRLYSLNCKLYLPDSDSISVLIMDKLKLSSSCCDALGSTLTHCTKLERLIIHETDLLNCVLHLSNLRKLAVLDISGVTLSSSCCDVLGSTLTHCTKLERLIIHETDLLNCVLHLSNLRKLAVLDISGVTLSSSCCDVLGNTLGND